MSDVGRLVVLAPNWLGDAVMLLPALASLRQWRPDAHLAVAARPQIAPLFSLVDGIDDVVTLSDARGWRGILRGADHERLANGRYATAVLFPNSFHAALVAKRSGIPERWGYRADLRGRLLTRAVSRPAHAVHQAEYYLALTTALGAPAMPLQAALRVPDALRQRARTRLGELGWSGGSIVAFAPGAAYGRAKQWPPDRVGVVAARLAAEAALTPALVGAASDAGTAREVIAAFRRTSPRGRVDALLDLTGQTDLPLLAAVLAEASAVVSNDSGAMHVAAAVGVPLAAIFGPTNEHATTPLPHPSGARVAVVAGEAWCRPCGLRACPVDHRCMRSISVDRVTSEVLRLVARPALPVHGSAR